MMMTDNALEIHNLTKKLKKFRLDVPMLGIPKGFATALIGENGAGKSTLINILAGIRLDYKGEILYADIMKESLQRRSSRAETRNSGKNTDDQAVRENTGYTGPESYFMPHWTVRQVGEVSSLLFDNFHKERYLELCTELGICDKSGFGDVTGKDIRSLSDGTKMKLMLAAVFARDTRLLLLDEPASPLDPLMRDKLCSMIREYLDEGNGERSVFFSTHNVTDMEYVTDYAVIMEDGKVAEQGFVEDLKEKYVLVKGEKAEQEKAKEILYSITPGAFGYEGICLAEDLDRLAGMDVKVETPTLSQISVAVMKHYTKLKA